MAKSKRFPADRLQQRAEEIQNLRDAVKETNFETDERDLAGTTSVVDQHPADHSDIVFERERDLTALQILDEEARQVQDAMQRQAEGTYGICANCGKEIPRERLEARPGATLCIDCQRQREADRAA